MGAGAGYSPFGAGFGDVFEDIFGDFFGTFTGQRRARPAKGDDLRYDLDITLMEAAFGVEKALEVPRWDNCTECRGTGAAPGKGPVTCSNCKGTGQVRFQQGFLVFQRHAVNVMGKAGLLQTPAKNVKAMARSRPIGI